MHNILDKLFSLPMTTPSGVQSLERAFFLLELIGSHQQTGLSQAEIQVRTGLDRTTLHRMLTFLASIHYLHQDAGSNRPWRLGVRSMSLGLQAFTQPHLVALLRPHMLALARRSQDNVFLVCRMGDLSFTLHLEQGPMAIASYQPLVGATRLLGLGTGSVALLAAMPDEALHMHLHRHQASYTASQFGPLKMQRAITRTRQMGYTLASDPAVSGAGVAFEVQGFGHVAISILSSRARMPVARRHEMARLILDEISTYLP